VSAQNVHIVGGGLVGPLCGIMLANKGFTVTIHERRADMRKGGVAAGRSINLAVTARGLKALEETGLKDKVMEISIPMRGRMVHDAQGNTSLQPYSQKEGECIYACSRGLLNILLLEEADKHKNIDIRFERRCTGYDIASSILTFEDETVQADMVIGADGAWSAVRRAMLENVQNFNYSQDFLEYGYKELVIPPGEGGGFRMEKNALHIWPRKSFMLIALPNMDGSFTCTLFYPLAEFAKLKTDKDVTAFFERDFPDAWKLMPTLAQDFFANPTGSLVTVRCAPWHAAGRAALIGDAAHAIVPFFGQGMNCGFEDCSVLSSLIKDNTPDWEGVFRQFEKFRKPNADAIAAMAVENFIEMRDAVADAGFLLRKKVAFELEKRFPEKFIPRYSMVVFRPDISYAEAQRRGALQDKILRELCANIGDPAQADWDKAARLIKNAI
jgi:kynurenine 3-monooxygenase